MTDEHNCHYYFYGPLEEFDKEDYEGMTIVPESEYTTKDLAELFGNVLEDRNYHRFVRLGWDILDSLNASSISECEKKFILEHFIKSFMDKYKL